MSKATERYDGKGREKVQCRLCNLWYHVIEPHLSALHRDGEWTLARYSGQFVGAPVESAHWTAKRLRTEASEAPEEEPEEEDDGIYRFGVASLQRNKLGQLSEYDRAFIPMHDEAWELGPQEVEMLETLALAIQDNENVLIVGPPGVGKTTLVMELACALDQSVQRAPFNGEMRLSSLIGSKDLKVDEASGQSVTQWTHGPLVNTAMFGHWFLADEFDAAPPPVTFVLHGVLEERRHLMLMDCDGGTMVEFHDRFRFIATANTLGYGDSSGLYAGTGPMNEALLDRFQTVIRMDYPGATEEIQRIKSKAPGIKSEWADKMVDVANKVRDAQRQNQVMTSMSPRRVIGWARKAVRFNNAVRAARVTFLDKIPQDDSKVVEAIIQRVFGTAGA